MLVEIAASGNVAVFQQRLHRRLTAGGMGIIGLPERLFELLLGRKLQVVVRCLIIIMVVYVPTVQVGGVDRYRRIGNTELIFAPTPL